MFIVSTGGVDTARQMDVIGIELDSETT